MAPKDQFPGNFTKFLYCPWKKIQNIYKIFFFLFLGIYKAKEFDTHTDFDDEDSSTDENENHPDFKPVPFFSLVRSLKFAKKVQKNSWNVHCYFFSADSGQIHLFIHYILLLTVLIQWHVPT